MYQDLYFYIDLDWEKYIENPIEYLENMYRLVDFIYQYKATVFYCKSQIDEFKAICDDDTEFSISLGDKLSIILQNAIEKNENQYAFEICFAGENSVITYLKNRAINSINSYSKVALISLNEKCYLHTLLIIRSINDFEKIKFDVLNQIDDIRYWITKNTVERKFNKSKKHGENGKGNWKGESVLLCDCEVAQNLLNSSIPDFHELDNRLFNFDPISETYIEFYYEGKTPNNQWHGFHLDPNDWDKRVPNKIRCFFKK